jgi:hypothetical protein
VTVDKHLPWLRLRAIARALPLSSMEDPSNPRVTAVLRAKMRRQRNQPRRTSDVYQGELLTYPETRFLVRGFSRTLTPLTAR